MSNSANTYILLIEDSPSQALQFRLLIQRFTGCPVRVFHDGIEGWKYACSHPPTLVLLDINLPMLDGFQILGRLKRYQDTAKVPVVMLTTSDNIGDVEQAIALGADDYLFKDDLFKSKEAAEQLYATIKQFLEVGEWKRMK